MSYDTEQFWEQYRAYKTETAEVHEQAFQLCLVASAVLWMDSDRLVNLGSGPDPEPMFKGRGFSVLSVDPQLGNKTDEDNLTLGYEDDAFISEVSARTGEPFLVTSFFSTEVVLAPERSRELYDGLFRVGAQAAIVSGFYYRGKRDQATVQEPGGLESYQSILPLEDTPGEVHEEKFRITLPVPSTMFGPDVVEVWRVLGPA